MKLFALARTPWGFSLHLNGPILISFCWNQRTLCAAHRLRRDMDRLPARQTIVA